MIRLLRVFLLFSSLVELFVQKKKTTMTAGYFQTYFDEESFFFFFLKSLCACHDSIFFAVFRIDGYNLFGTTLYNNDNVANLKKIVLTYLKFIYFKLFDTTIYMLGTLFEFHYIQI